MSSLAIYIVVLASTMQVNLRTNGLSIDYQKFADSAKWKWSDCGTSPLSGVSSIGASKYDIELHWPADRETPFIKISRDGTERANVKFHSSSVSTLYKDSFVYILFSPAGRGGQVIRIDLTSGKEVWRSPLKGTEKNGAHWAHSTRFNIEIPNWEVVEIWGNESDGKYLEIKSLETGETVGHKIFSTLESELLEKSMDESQIQR